MTKKDEEKLNKEIAALEADEDAQFAERQEELDWITEQLVDMDDANFKKFMRSIKFYRKANFFRGEMSSNA